MTTAECHYKVLELEYTASIKEIRAAYHKQSLRWHPDKNMHNPEQAKKRFQKIQAAYECLSDPTAKALYDLEQFADRERERLIRERKEREERIRQEQELRAAKEKEAKIKQERERLQREQEIRERIAREKAEKEEAELQEALRKAYEETEAKVKREAETLRRQLASPFACSLDDFKKKLRGMRLDEMWTLHKMWNTQSWVPFLKTEKEARKAVPKLARMRADLEHEIQLKTFHETQLAETEGKIRDLQLIGTESIALAFNQAKREGLQDILKKHEEKISRLLRQIANLDNDRAEEMQRQYDVERIFIALLLFREGLLIDEKLRIVELTDAKIQEFESLDIDCSILRREVHGCFNLMAIDEDPSDFENPNLYDGECDRCYNIGQIKCMICDSATKRNEPCVQCGLRMRACTSCQFVKHIPWATKLCSVCKKDTGYRKPSLMPFGSAWSNKRELYDPRVLIF